MTIMSSHKPQTGREMPSFLIHSSAVKSVGSGGWLQSGVGCVTKGGGVRAGPVWGELSRVEEGGMYLFVHA